MSEDKEKGLSGKAALVGAAIGSAAIAAAVLWVKRRRDKQETRYVAPHPDKTPETD